MPASNPPGPGSITATHLAAGAVTLAAVAGDVLPAGIILPYGGTAAPDGWLMCDGTEYSSTGAYANLYTALGTAYNTGGETTGYFRVPDLRGRVGVGTDNMGTARGAAGVLPSTGTPSFNNTRGSQGGLARHTLTANESGVKAHGHTASSSVSDPGHGHSWSYSGKGSNITTGSSAYSAFRWDGPTDVSYGGLNGSVGSNTTGIGVSTSVNNHAGESAGAAHTNMPPYVVVNYIVKY